MTPILTTAALLSVKIFVLIGIVVYAAFAAVIVRQEQLMADVLEEEFEPKLKLLTRAHLIASVGLFFLAFFIL